MIIKTNKMKTKYLACKDYKKLFEKDIKIAQQSILKNEFLNEQLKEENIKQYLITLSLDEHTGFAIFYSIVITKIEAIMGKSNKSKILRELKKAGFFYYDNKIDGIGSYVYSSELAFFK